MKWRTEITLQVELQDVYLGPLQEAMPMQWDPLSSCHQWWEAPLPRMKVQGNIIMEDGFVGFGSPKIKRGVGWD